VTTPVSRTPTATFEGPGVTLAGECARLFEQDDHVREYAPGLAHCLEEAGIVVSIDEYGRRDPGRDVSVLDEYEQLYLGSTAAAGLPQWR
jgi:hypothetical protein